MADVVTGVALLLVPVLAEYAKLRAKAAKAFNFIAAAGVLTFLGVAFAVFGDALLSGYTVQVAYGGALLFDFIAWILVLVGALWAAVKLVTSK